jgi:tRNA (Thr-GGU) A37 N-methylase
VYPARAEVTAVDGLRVRVSGLEAVDGTPVLDLKPVLDEDVNRR